MSRKAFWWTERQRRKQGVRQDVLRRLEVLEKLLDEAPPDVAAQIRELLPDVRAAVSASEGAK